MARPKGSKTNPDRPVLPFKQSEVQRAIRAVQDRGLTIAGVAVDPRSGKFTIMTGKPTADAGTDLDKWMDKHAGAVEGH